MSSQNDNRNVLKEGSVIQLLPYEPRKYDEWKETAPSAAGRPVSFAIDKVEGRGSSAICYEARMITDGGPGSKHGMLKEFYPVDSDNAGFEVHMQRTESVDDTKRNQLYASFGTFANFSLLERIYESSYAIINEKRNPENGGAYARDLNKYIPTHRYFRGIPSQPEHDALDSEIAPVNTTFYVWVENEAGYKQFREYLTELCGEMQKAYQEDGFVDNRIGDLDYILRCVLELTKSIQALHRFGMYHLDLNPRNFGVQLYESKIDRDLSVINLYDTNSLLYGRDPNQIVFSAGTEYFRSEEVKNGWTGSCGIQSDIYSIGTILYYALVIRENGGIYRNVHYCEGMEEGSREAFDRIPLDLANSELLLSSDDTRSSFLQERIAGILKKALNRFGDPCGTYRVAEDLADDIDKLLQETGVALWAAAHPGYHATMQLEEEETRYDRSYGATGAIERLLLKRPLYDYYTVDDSNEIRRDVLVLGCGAYASEFIDFALELSQIRDCLLHVTVATKDAEARKKNYLDQRGSMQDFVAVDGSLTDAYPGLSPYGYLDFTDIDFLTDHPDDIKAELKDVLGDRQFSYVFIAMNDERLNKRAAKACIEAGIVPAERSVVAFVQYKTLKRETVKAPLYPVNVTATLSDSEEYRLLKQMAFNVHLSWYKNYINDLAGADAEFRKKYYFNSSMENALSGLYKLHSIGIPLDFSHPEKAALAFAKRFVFNEKGKITDKASKQDYNELIWYEHRRWIIEKVTEGWKTMPPEEIPSLKTSAKDYGGKKHPCLVPSCIFFGLKEPDWHVNMNKRKWDDRSADVSGLDPLDRLSVELHRHWKDIFDSDVPRTETDKLLDLLDGEAAAHEKLISLGSSLRYVIEELLGNKENQTDLLEKYYHIVQQIQRYAASNKLKQITELLEELEKQMFPVIEYLSYSDWKDKDVSLIRKLPFILTYHTSIHLCIPFYYEKKSDNNTSRLFSNVASALMLNPKKITYLIDGDMLTGDAEGLLEALTYASNIVNGHGLQTSFHVKLLRDRRFTVSQELTEAIKRVRGVDTVELMPYEPWQKTTALCQFLTQSSSRSITALEINDTPLSGYLQSANAAAGAASAAGDKALPEYRFDAVTQEFATDDGSEFLSYVRNDPVLFAEDLYVSKGKRISASRPEMMFAYEIAWALYSGKSGRLSVRNKNACSSAWKRLCKAISDKQNASVLADVHYQEGDFREDAAPHTVIVPAFCRSFLEEFLNLLDLSPFRFFRSFDWTSLSPHTEMLTIEAPVTSLRTAVTKLVSDPMKISQRSLLNIIRVPDGFRVTYDSLTVSDLTIPKDNGKLCLEMLEALNEENLIRFLNGNPAAAAEGSAVSFVFASEVVMALFLSEGCLFELNTYYEAVRSGYFDDVSTGVEIVWSNDYGIKNEVDVVLTRGFQTVTIECKAQDAINQEYYYKLYPLAKTFGVNTIPVLLVDLNDSVAAKNDMEIRRGRELGIRTICSSDNIAKTLRDLFEAEKQSQREKMQML